MADALACRWGAMMAGAGSNICFMMFAMYALTWGFISYFLSNSSTHCLSHCLRDAALRTTPGTPSQTTS